MARSPIAVVTVAREGARRRLRAGPWLVLFLLVAVRVGLDLHWHALDNGLPDGDESGHLGAIELYRGIIDDKGLVEAVRTGFSSTSEYPPLFALVNGALFSLFYMDGPFPRGVPVLLCFWTALSLVAVAWMTTQAERYPWGRGDRGCGWHAGGSGVSRAGWTTMSWSGVLAAAVYATSPLSAAVGRHAMLEPFLALWVALSLALAFSSRQFSRSVPTVLLGISLALGFLAKQTFVLYVTGPLALMVLDSLVARRGQAVARLVLLAVVATPVPIAWTWAHWEEQASYGVASAAAKADVGIGFHLLYYPAVLAGLGLGAAWVLPGIISVLSLLWRRRWRLVTVLFLTLGILTLVPKKYPRLIIPAMPLVATVTAVGLICVSAAGWRRFAAGIAAIAGLLQQAVVAMPVDAISSRAGTWRPAFFHRVDPACPQIWIRAPHGDDLGFEDVLALVKRMPSRHAAKQWLGMVEEPAIPCGYETTFHYAYHLEQYLRRHGVPLDDIPVYALEPDRFSASAGEFQMVIASKPWCDRGRAGVAPPEDWTPPPVEWHVERLKDTLSKTVARDDQPAGQTAQKHHAQGPSRRETDPCGVRSKFVLDAHLTYLQQTLPFELFVYERVR